jgi:hypothetical protein
MYSTPICTQHTKVSFSRPAALSGIEEADCRELAQWRPEPPEWLHQSVLTQHVLDRHGGLIWGARTCTGTA